MNKAKITIIFLLVTISTFSQLTVTKDGLLYDGSEYIVINIDGYSSQELTTTIEAAIKTKHHSQNIRVERLSDNQLLVSDLVKGFTKTDRSAGSAYLFDLHYKITIDFKDDKIRVSAPVISIGSQNKFYSDNNQFKLSMEVFGKNDVWSDDYKRFYIYNEKGKLLEKSTKEKLESLFNGFNEMISGCFETNDDW